MTARFASGTFCLRDCRTEALDASALLGPTKVRDPAPLVRRRAQALLEANRGVLRELGVSGHVEEHREGVCLVLSAGTRVGAVPLLSPVTHRPDFGLVVVPRFAWRSVGRCMARTGFKRLPDLLPLPELPRSERHVPTWVLSSVVLDRLAALLKQETRSFTQVDERVERPRGRVRWGRWAAQELARGRTRSYPSRFPDLREDEELLSAVRGALERQRTALREHRAEGRIVLQLLDWCEALLQRVAHVQPRTSLPRRQPMPHMGRVFREGLDAMAWTFDERGLAGQQELDGLPWRMNMEEFFEAWVETLAEGVQRRVGGVLSAGRTEATRRRLTWEPTAGAALRSLAPDVVLQLPDHAVILDAKYKGHFSALEHRGGATRQQRDHHRRDVHQVLAYASLSAAPRVTAVLAYPCRLEDAEDLARRGRLVRAARIAAPRWVELLLLAVPLGGELGPSVDALTAWLLRDAA